MREKYIYKRLIKSLHNIKYITSVRVAQRLPKTHTSISPIQRGFVPSFVNYAAASDKITSCLPMVGGFLRVLRPLKPLKLVALI